MRIGPVSGPWCKRRAGKRENRVAVLPSVIGLTSGFGSLLAPESGANARLDSGQINGWRWRFRALRWRLFERNLVIDLFIGN